MNDIWRIYGGQRKDGIPAINLPLYLSREEADEWLDDSDIIFGLELHDQTIAFPQRILVYHEIVNVRVNESWVSVTYCPLTGSAIGYDANLNGHKTTFGTSGDLANSNLVMYDRLSDSFWPQILGQSIFGTSLGMKLSKIHILWSNWGLWKNYYPDTLVLSKETGRIRNYDLDPYGGYGNNKSYYNSGYPIFPVQNYVPLLDDKDVVVGIEHNNSYLAIEKDLVKQEKVINAQVANDNIVAIYDKNLDVVRVFKSELFGQKLTFKLNNGKIVDEQINIEWSVDGTSILGSLKQEIHYDVMWFAWIAFYPDSGLVQL